jgi:hypothetical protein
MHLSAEYDFMTWNEDNLVELSCAALANATRELDSEDSTRGIDGPNEAEIQQRISETLGSHSVVAIKEARYPAARITEQLNHGKRCDLLLFQDSADLELLSQLDADKIGYWEIKRVAQFLESGPNWHYERTLLELLPQDVYKLANDPRIFYAGLLVILFAGIASIGNRDLHTWKYHAMSQGCPIGIPRICDFSSTNRIGNEHAFVALFPIRRL